jgi:hypothetical protein
MRPAAVAQDLSYYRLVHTYLVRVPDGTCLNSAVFCLPIPVITSKMLTDLATVVYTERKEERGNHIRTNYQQLENYIRVQQFRVL